MRGTHHIALMVAIVLNTVFGAVLLAGGVWLITLGGSWYYALAGVALLITAVLLGQRRTSALWVYAGVVLATLLWALWESGLDWWPLAARGAVLFLLGIFMVTPWVTRPLRLQRPDANDAGQTNNSRRAAAPLMVGLVVFLGVGVASWFVDPHSQEGALPGPRAQAVLNDHGIPHGEWHAYGRNNAGTGLALQNRRCTGTAGRTGRNHFPGDTLEDR